MEIREGNVIINVDDGLDKVEQEIVGNCASIIDAVVTTKRSDFRLVSQRALIKVLQYIATILEKERE